MGLNRQEDLMELLADQQEEALQLMRAREAREREAAEAPARAAAAAADAEADARMRRRQAEVAAVAGRHLSLVAVLVAGTVADTFEVGRADEHGIDLSFEIAPPAFQPADIHRPGTPPTSRGWMWLDKQGIPSGVEVRRSVGLFDAQAALTTVPSVVLVGKRAVRQDRHILTVKVLYKQQSRSHGLSGFGFVRPHGTASRRWAVVSEDGRYWNEQGRWIPTNERRPPGAPVDVASRHWHDGYEWLRY